jgi:hypothetical protein
MAQNGKVQAATTAQTNNTVAAITVIAKTSAAPRVNSLRRDKATA